MVAEYDGEVAGAVHLRVTTMTPINLERVVQAVSPHVLPRYRRHGVGRALMDAAVSFAEELGIGHVATAAASGSRDANRFMARLALGPWAVLRVASTPMLRSKLTAHAPHPPPEQWPSACPRCWRRGARCGARARRRRWPTRAEAHRLALRARRPAQAAQAWNRSRGSSVQVIREVQTRLPRSSVITTS